jgi:tRNA G10  N-methylase Trm11
VHSLGYRSVGVELEPEWAGAHPKTICGDALHLPFGVDAFDALVTSPTYGNRMADDFEARDSSHRNTYRHQLGRPLSPGSSAGMQWGPRYRAFHYGAWAEAARVVRPGGIALVNVSDHIRKGERIPVVDYHVEALARSGWAVLRRVEVSTPRLRYGSNHDKRVESETIIIARRKGLVDQDGRRSSDSVTRNAPGSHPRSASDDLDSTPVVECDLTARRLKKGPGGGEGC